MRHTFVYYRDWLQLKSYFRRMEHIADQLGIHVDRLHEYNMPVSYRPTPTHLSATRMRVYRAATEASEKTVC